MPTTRPRPVPSSVHGQIDFAYDYDEDNRFRVNLFHGPRQAVGRGRLITSNIKRSRAAPAGGAGDICHAAPGPRAASPA
jgi:hypothetical protein